MFSWEKKSNEIHIYTIILIQTSLIESIRSKMFIFERELAKLAAVQVESLGKPEAEEVTIYKSLDRCIITVH